jgi:signal transduction histidine kinase
VGLSSAMADLDHGARYDDSVLNLLRLESDRTPSSRIALYRNLIDLMMQNRASTQGGKRSRIFETLGRIHEDIPEPVRRQVAETVARQKVNQSLDLASWLWAADPDVVLHMMPTLRLSEPDWLHLLPRLPQAALAQLAARTDMGDQVRRALASLGATGLGLPPAPVRVPQHQDDSIFDLAQPFEVTPTDTPATFVDTPVFEEAEVEEEQALHLLPVDEAQGPDFAATPNPDWSQLSSRQTEKADKETAHARERIDFIARAVLGGNTEAVDKLAGDVSNDDQPVLPDELERQAISGHAEKTPVYSQADTPAESVEEIQDEIVAPVQSQQQLSDEAQKQIRDLLGRIADFRKRWIDKVPDAARAEPVMDDTATREALSVVAETIETEISEQDSSQSVDESSVPAQEGAAELPADEKIAAQLLDTLPEEAPEQAPEAVPDDQSPLMLTPAIAANLGPSEAASPTPVKQSRVLADIAASLADFQWESDRSGRFVQANATQVDVDHGAGLVPAMAGRALASLFTDESSRSIVTRALSRRTAFRDALFAIDVGPMQGLWRLSGVPVFDPATGLYLGHRGVAERLGAATQALQSPSAETPPEKITKTQTDKTSTGDRLSTLAHETRTPMNAIMGFAQLINAETWGEVPEQYRARASAILEESNRLLRALDDVSDQAKIDRGAYAAHVSAFHPADVLITVRDVFAQEAERRQLQLLTRISDGLPNIWSDRDGIERALGRLIVVALAGAKAGDLIILSVRALPNDDVCFSIAQPARPASDISPENGSGGFGIRLVRQLAGVLSGRLDLSDRRFDLIIPAIVHLPAEQRERK